MSATKRTTRRSTTRKTSTRRRTTTRRTTTTRRSTPKLATTLGAALGAVIVSLVTDMSWPMRIVVIVAAVVLAVGWLLWSHRAEIVAAADDAAPSPTDPSPPAPDREQP